MYDWIKESIVKQTNMEMSGSVHYLITRPMNEFINKNVDGLYINSYINVQLLIKENAWKSFECKRHAFYIQDLLNGNNWI